MKTRALLAFVLFAVSAFAQTPPVANITVTFEPGAIGSGNVEHFVEVRGAGNAWSEVAKAPGSPISWSIENPAPGSSVTARVRARLVANPAVVSEPSNEVAAIIPPFRPGQAKISVSLVVTLETSSP